MSVALDRYNALASAMERAGFEENDVTRAILDEMDDVWLLLTDEDRANAEFPHDP